MGIPDAERVFGKTAKCVRGNQEVDQRLLRQNLRGLLIDHRVMVIWLLSVPQTIFR